MRNCDITEVMGVGVECYRGIWIGLGATFFVGLCALFCFIGCYWERLFARCCRILRGQAENPDCSEVALERKAEATPLLMRISSPSNQVSCSGDYDLIPEDRPNGQPMWKKRGADRWLYSGDDGRWYIGGVSSKDRRFACSSGFIYHNKVHEGVLPHKLSGTWEWGGGAAWHKDATIAVVAVPGARASGSMRLTPSETGDERFGSLAYKKGNSLNSLDLQPSPKGRSRWQSGLGSGKKNSPSETSTDDGGPQLATFVDSSDGSSSMNRTSSDTLPLPVASRPRQSPWRAPGRLVQILDEPGAEVRSRSDEEPPRILCVTSPTGQQECAGEYMLVERMKPNGQPVWRQQNGEHWLYSGTTSRWCIGGQDVKDDNFARSAGWVCQTVAHDGMMPDKVLAPWQRWDGNTFLKDHGISVIGRPQPELSIVI